MALRFYVPNIPKNSDAFLLPQNTIKHINVLRLKNGTEITLFDGSGSEFNAILDIQNKNSFIAKITNQQNISRESSLQIILIQAVSTGEKMDFTVQKATELGVSEIYPVITERSNVRLSGERAEKRRNRWQEIAISACEQCGRNIIPNIRAVESLNNVLNNLPSADKYILLSPKGSLKLNAIKDIPQKVVLLIGAEGGFSQEEDNSANKAGFVPITLGQRILRTETAGLATISSLQTLWGDFAS